MAHILPNAVLQRLRGLVMPNPPVSSNRDATSPDNEQSDGHSVFPLYQPTLIDIAVVHILLNRSKKLPPDLVDTILDHAEYWAHSSNEIDFVALNGSPEKINGRGPAEDKLLIRSYPLGMTGLNGKKTQDELRAYRSQQARALPLYPEHDAKFFNNLVRYPMPKIVKPARKIVFSIKGKDQGWGSRNDVGTYGKSWSWYETGLERFQDDENGDVQLSFDDLRPVRPSVHLTSSPREASADNDYEYEFPLEPQPDLAIHRNKVGDKNWQDHVVTWSYLDNVNPDSDGGQALQEEGRGRATADGQFVRDLKLGDVITIWSKVRFPGWVNQVERVKIDVYWTLS